MIRSVKIISSANIGKISKLRQIFLVYNQCVNYFLKKLWLKDIGGRFISAENERIAKNRFLLTARLTQSAGKQALDIIRSQRCFDEKGFPRFKRLTVDLNYLFWRIIEKENSFNWIKLRSVGCGMYIPFKKTKMWNKWVDNGFTLSKSMRMSIKKNKLVLEFFFEKDAPTLKSEGEIEGLDLGYRNLAVCSNGKTVGGRMDKIIKSFGKREKHTHLQVRQKSFQELKKLNLTNVSMLVVENLKHVKSGARGTFSRSHNRRMSHWLYAKVREWLKQRCEEQGIRLEFKSPFATSQYCRFCGKWDRRNRSGDRFQCIHCGHEDHADSNASQNLKLLGLAEVYSLRSLAI